VKAVMNVFHRLLGISWLLKKL